MRAATPVPSWTHRFNIEIGKQSHVSLSASPRIIPELVQIRTLILGDEASQKFNTNQQGSLKSKEKTSHPLRYDSIRSSNWVAQIRSSSFAMERTEGRGGKLGTATDEVRSTGTARCLLIPSLSKSEAVEESWRTDWSREYSRKNVDQGAWS